MPLLPSVKSLYSISWLTSVTHFNLTGKKQRTLTLLSNTFLFSIVLVLHFFSVKCVGQKRSQSILSYLQQWIAVHNPFAIINIIQIMWFFLKDYIELPYSLVNYLVGETMLLRLPAYSALTDVLVSFLLNGKLKMQKFVMPEQ